MIDLIFAVLLIIACIKGYRKGLIVALFSIIAYIIGLAAALKLSTVVAEYLKFSLNLSAKWLPFISFALVFIVVVVVVNWSGRLIEKAFQVTLLGAVNRLGGVLLYIVIYLIIYSVFLFYAEKTELIAPSAFQTSKSYSFIEPWGPIVIDGFGKALPLFNDMFSKLEDFFAQIPQKTRVNRIPLGDINSIP